MVSMSQQLSAHDGGNEADQRPRTAMRGKARSLGQDGRSILVRTVEHDVIPLLVAMPWVTRAPAAPVAAAVPVSTIDPMLIGNLVALCLAPDGLAVAGFVARLHEGGATPESIYLGLLTPAARRLGDMWVDDECSFADVTVAVLRLQNAQRALAPQFVGPAVPGLGAPRALLLPVPGEQHTFGLSMVRDFFARAGWLARTDSADTETQALAIVRAEPCDLIGLSFACDDRIDTAERLIAEFRAVSPNRNLIVMVGGPSFVADPGLCARVGADGTAADGHQAVLTAHELVHARHGMAAHP